MLTILLSAVMIASPDFWSRGIVWFSRKSYFHAAEVFTRLLLGGVLIAGASQTRHPELIGGIGYVLLGVALFLILLGARRHHAFALRSASFVRLFRPAGVVSLLFGIFVLYSAFG